MYNIVKTMADNLSANNKGIKFAHNSVFSAMELNNNQQTEGEIVTLIASVLKNDVSNIKNNYIPYIKEFAKLVEAKLLASNGGELLSNYTVKPFGLPDIVSELESKGMLVEPTLPTPLSNNILVINYSDLETPIKNIAKFDNGVLNTLLGELLVDKSEEDLRTLWDKYLSNISALNDNIHDMYNIDFTNIDELIIMLAIVSQIKDSKQPGVRMSEGNYLVTMSLLYSELIVAISNTVNKYKLSIKFDRLIIGSTNDTLYVNKDLYSTFLKDNTVEVLLGYLVKGMVSNSTTMESLIVDKDSYLKAWDNALKMEAFKRSSIEVSRHKIAHELVLKDMDKDYNEVAEDEVSYVPESVNKQLHELYETLDDVTITNIKVMSRTIMGKLVFPSTNLYKFTSYMLKYTENDIKITPEEAATMATVDMLMDYLLQQIVIEE